MNAPPPANEPLSPRAQDVDRGAIRRARRGFLGAVATGVGAALLVGFLWFAARDAPSAERDPEWTWPAAAPTRTPTDVATPESTAPPAQ